MRLFKNVVAQFIGRLCLVNQATTRIWGRKASEMPKIERKIKIKQPNYNKEVNMPKALEKIKVLDLTRMYAGPYCTMLLKDLGAEIIKVEIPGGGDGVRTLPPLTKASESMPFIVLNRGKKSVTLNLQSEKGREIVKELAKKADILVENFTPGVMDRLGLGYEELSKVNPGLIYTSLSGYGHTGPRQDLPAFDMVAQAMGGFMSVTGFPDGPPTKAGTAVGDICGSLYTTIAILAALHHRTETGEGQFVDISLQDCVWAFTTAGVNDIYFLTGENPQRFGNGYYEGVPFNVYHAKDGYIVICIITIGQWQGFLRLIGREDLIGVEKYATQVERVNHRDEVDALVAEWTKTKCVTEIENEFKKAHLPCSPVPRFVEVANDPQLLSREMITEVEQLISGKLRVPGTVFKLSKTPGDVTLPAPFLGEHNYEVYPSMLGYNEEELGKLTEEGII